MIIGADQGFFKEGVQMVGIYLCHMTYSPTLYKHFRNKQICRALTGVFSKCMLMVSPGTTYKRALFNYICKKKPNKPLLDTHLD